MFQTDVLSFCGYALETEFSDSKARCAYFLQFLTNKALSICIVVLYIINAIQCHQIKKNIYEIKKTTNGHYSRHV